MGIFKNNSYSRQLFFWGVGTFLLIFAALSPVLESGYIGDDAINSTTKGCLIETGKNVWEHSFFYFTAWFQNGRFAPISFFYVYPLFTYLPGLYSYKFAILSLIFLNLIIFGYWIFLFTKSIALSFLGILLVSLLFQFRIYHDPIYSYHGLQQIVFIFFLSSLIFLYHYLEKKRNYLLFISLLAYLLSLLTYEITYPFFILHFIVIYYSGGDGRLRIRRSLKLVSPFLILSLSLALLTLFIRIHQGSLTDKAYTANFQFLVYFSTWLKQISAAFPLSYFLSDPLGIFRFSFDFAYQNFSITNIMIGFGYLILLVSILQECYGKHISSDVIPRKLAVWGILFLILPGAIISLSPKYQKEVDWGVGYLPVYLSYFGLASCILFLFHKFYKRILPKIMNLVTILIGVCCGLVGIVNFNNNRMVIENLNGFWLYPRKVIEEGVKNGLFRELSKGSTLIVDSSYPWESKAFYRMHSGIQFKEVRKKGEFLDEKWKSFTTNSSIEKFQAYEFPEEEKIFYLYYESLMKEMGFAILGQIGDFWASPDEIQSASAQKVLVYIHWPFFQARNQDVFRGDYINLQAGLEPFMMMIGEKENIISSGPNWRLYSFHKADGFIDLKSVQPDFSQQPRPHSFSWKKLGQFHLPEKQNTVLHTGFLTLMVRPGTAFKKVALGDSFTIETIVNPSNGQVPYAGILGNHPGFNNYEGFVLQQDGKEQNTFIFAYGDGGKWLPGIRFKLIPNRWNYVAILVGENTIRVFQNGEWGSATDTKGTFKNSEMPLHIGNWYYGDRPFRGIIDEVKIVNRRMAEREIQKNWQTLKRSELFSGS